MVPFSFLVLLFPLGQFVVVVLNGMNVPLKVTSTSAENMGNSKVRVFLFKININ